MGEGYWTRSFLNMVQTSMRREALYKSLGRAKKSPEMPFPSTGGRRRSLTPPA